MQGQSSFVTQSAGMKSCLKNAIIKKKKKKKTKSLPIFFKNKFNFLF